MDRQPDSLPGAGARFLALRGEVARICLACGRRPEEITLVAVSKNASPQDAAEAVRAGATDLGENRVQELLAKREYLASRELHPQWHLIGTLQTNKVRQVVGKTCLIHSVDRLPLASEISRRSEALDIRTPVLLQFNIAGEESKHGYDPSDALEALAQAAALKGLSIEGLMAMAPMEGAVPAAEKTFEAAKNLYDRLRASGVVDAAVFCKLSMGMSGDYEAAIHAGATHIRVGSLVFGHLKV